MKINNKVKVFVGLSGGVDSSVAAYLLKKQGNKVVGVHLHSWNRNGCDLKEAEDARRVANHLGIPFYVFDLEKEYKEKVIDYMIEGYAAGLTPNPDVMCNKEIKFGVFLEKALELGADYIATGHYVRLVERESFSSPNPTEASLPCRQAGGHGPRAHLSIGTRISRLQRAGFLLPRLAGSRFARDQAQQACGMFRTTGGLSGASRVISEVSLAGGNERVRGRKTFSLYIPKDKNKDQSYFLWTLTEEQLKHCLFPLGDYLKSEVRQIAKEAGLPTAEKKDSQGLCFVGKISLGEFLAEYLPVKRGLALSVKGQVLGEHQGAHLYTIGQRHGLGVALNAPHYITEKDVRTNTVVLAPENDSALYRKKITLTEVNFINQDYISNILVRIRYRQPLSKARLYPPKSAPPSASIRIIFNKPQKFVAPGQSAVFYSESGELLGGGVIS